VPEFKSRAEKWFWYLLVGCATVVAVALVAVMFFVPEIVGAFVQIARTFGMRGALIAGAVILVFILILWRLGREE
jgi:hypothetical protein